MAHEPDDARPAAGWRALGAAIGAGVTMVGWNLTEQARHPGGAWLPDWSLIAEGRHEDFVLQLAMVGLPILISALACFLLVRFRPRVRSWWLAPLVTCIGLATGSFVMLVAGSLGGKWPPLPQFLGSWLLMSLFGAMRVGGWAILAGWGVFVAWDLVIRRRHWPPSADAD